MREGEHYHYDKIRINSKATVKFLNKMLPMSELKSKSNFFQIMPASKVAHYSEFSAKIEIVVPSKEFFELLTKYEMYLWPYKISYLEIAKDEFCPNEWDANKRSFERTGNLRKKWTPRHQTYPDTNSEDFQTTPIKNKSLFGDRTDYYGGKKFEYVIYPRYSKINGKPCVHSEWRILSASAIRKKTGISYIRDLIKFDHMEFHKKQEQSQLTYEYIDTKKVGKWLLGLSRRKKLTGRKKLSVGLACFTFFRANNIRSYADLVFFLSEEKKKVKLKRGRKSKWEKKILAVRDYGRFRRL